MIAAMSDTAETQKLQMTHDTSAEYPCTDIQPTLAKKKKQISHACFNHNGLAIRHYVSIIVTVYYHYFGKISFFYLVLVGLVNNA